jgi:uracil-DNA glycosylase family 4
MLTKPDSCRDCPLYQDGKGFVPDELIEGAETFVMGQNPGEEEEREGRPFIGATGKAMMKHYFPLGGLERGVNVSIGNIIRCRYQNSNELPKLGTKEKLAEKAIEHCTRAHLRIPSGTKLIVAQGAYALWGLTGERAISEWRGWLLPLKEGVLNDGRGLVSISGVSNSSGVVSGPVRLGADEEWGVDDGGTDSSVDGLRGDRVRVGDVEVFRVGREGAGDSRGHAEEGAVDVERDSSHRLFRGGKCSSGVCCGGVPDIEGVLVEGAVDVNGGSDSSTTDIYHPGPVDIPVLATLHLAALFRNPELQLPTRLDWIKAKRYLAGEWPKRLPPIQTTPPTHWPLLSAFDTEYTYPGPKRLLRYNLATIERDVYVVEAKDITRHTLSSPRTVVMHNAIADLAFLQSIVRPASLIRMEDTMLAHSVLWSGMGREDDEASRRGGGFGQGLDFLGSMYASINRWKHLAESNPVVYAAGDAIATLDLWSNVQRQFAADPPSEWVYRNCVLPLLPAIKEAEERGLKVNKTRVKEVAQELEAQVTEAQLRAQAAVGYPINLGSSAQVAFQLYQIERIDQRV